MRRSVCLFSLLSCFACSGDEATKTRSDTPPERAEPSATKVAEPQRPAQPTKPEAMPAKDGFFMAEGAPEPRACKVADDCTGNTIPDLDNPCCQDPRTLEPYARAYWTWINDWRREHCEAVTCPPPPSPSLPPKCAFEVDCVAGICVDACP